MGIDIWTRREMPGLADIPIPPDVIPPAEMDVPATPANNHDVSQLDWRALQAKVSTCTLCDLQQSRTQTVFGAGNQQADLLIIGEAPGTEEDQQGEPFVGQTGQLLNAMLKAIKFSRQSVYITNILKCQPPNNRPPKSAEAALCSQYLKRQIELIQPKLILAVGSLAAQDLLQTTNSLSELRGQLHQYTPTNTPMITTYHPTHLLQTPLDKAKAWQDLLFVQRTLGDQMKAG